MNPELKIQVRAAAAQLALHVQQAMVEDIAEALEKLTEDEIDMICRAPSISPTERYPMRGAKILLQVQGEHLLRDFDAEAIQPMVKRVKRILRNRP